MDSCLNHPRNAFLWELDCLWPVLCIPGRGVLGRRRGSLRRTRQVFGIQWVGLMAGDARRWLVRRDLSATAAVSGEGLWRAQAEVWGSPHRWLSDRVPPGRSRRTSGLSPWRHRRSLTRYYSAFTQCRDALRGVSGAAKRLRWVVVARTQIGAKPWVTECPPRKPGSPSPLRRRPTGRLYIGGHPPCDG